MFFGKSVSKWKIDVLKGSPLFDADDYAKEFGLAAARDPVRHYLENWAHSLANPSKFFDAAYYLKLYGDVAERKINPLLHYLTNGWKEGRSPSPLFDRNEFLAAHPYVQAGSVDLAEFCIRAYGDYNWKARRALPRVASESTNKKVTPGVVIPEISIPDVVMPEIVMPEVVVPEVVAEDSSDSVAKLCSSEFDQEYYISTYPDVKASGMDPYIHYMNHGFAEDRNPRPDFDVFFYKNTYLEGRNDINPFVHYLTVGRSTNFKTRSENSKVIGLPHDEAVSLSVCVHVHCFYPELLGEVCAGILNFPEGSHIVVTVCTEADRQYCSKYLKQYVPHFSNDVILVQNRGRDIAPFIVGCADIWKKYDVVLHLHTKRSKHISWGDAWRKYIYDQTMGSKDLVAAVLGNFARNEDLGALYPENYYDIKKFIITNANAEGVKSALRFLEIDEEYCSAEFAAGSMAWYRTSSLDSLIEKINDVELFESEDGQVDGTFAHALERVIPAQVRANGYSVCAYSTPIRTSVGEPLPGSGRDFGSSFVTDAWPRDSVRAVHPPRPLAPPSRSFNSKSLDIHWVIPGFGKGAGGHMTIFRMVKYLEEFGHQQTIWVQNANHIPNEEVARQQIIDWYVKIGSNVSVLYLPEDVRQLSGDVIIATDCWTAFPVSQAQKFKERFYFIQDFEPDFHPAGANRLVAESTYDLGFSALCAGDWLDGLMKERGCWSRSWDLAADHEIYFPVSSGSGGAFPMAREVQIAFYARPYTPRRAVELGFAALERLKKSGRRFHVHLFGEHNIDVPYDFPCTQHGVLSHEQLAVLYQSSDIGLVYSATNYSLIPLEMIACGLPVVELDVPSTRAIFKNDEVAFAPPTPYGIADTIEGLLNNPDKMNRQRENGFTFIRNKSWEGSARKVEASIIEKLRDLGFGDVSSKIFAPVFISKPKVSVFIPTYNAGKEFEAVLNSVVSQRTDFEYDVLVIDSSSTDGTPGLVGKFGSKKVRLHQIDKRDFQHGRTRNLGISMTDGDYVAILTQDAMPANDAWLASLIGGFKQGDRVAGVTGRHRAYPTHGPFVSRDIEGHFDNLKLLPSVIDSSVGLPSHYFRGSITWRMLAYFYSDNNSAMSRRVWKDLPYPDIEWGEDYVWSASAIKAGYQKAYVDEAVVFHSHDLSEKDTFKVAMAEGKFWAAEFGIKLHTDASSVIAQMCDTDRRYARENGIVESVLKRRLKSIDALVRGRMYGWKESQSRDVS